MRIEDFTKRCFNNHNVNENKININNTKQRSKQFRCVFLHTYYKAFIEQLYGQNPQLYNASYDVQKKILIDQLFGDSDFYSSSLTKAGWDCHDIIINILPLQNAWAKENGFSGQDMEIALEQVKRLRPDILYMHDIGPWNKLLFDKFRPYANIIVGQTASPVPDHTYVEGFDIFISSFPHYVHRLRLNKTTAYYQPLAFDPKILANLGTLEKIYPVTFVGSISPMHQSGNNIIEILAELIPIEIWGYGADSLPKDSPVLRKHRGEAWGANMFKLLAQSKITINRHIDAAENYANNMRLFEATGCGALVITDYKDNLNDLFQIGKEIIAYKSPEECIELVKYYLDNEEEALKIAKAGQARTLKDHNYDLRMKQTSEILSRHLRYKKDLGKYERSKSISTGYRIIEGNEVTKGMIEAWKNKNLPLKQRALVQDELLHMYKGEFAHVYFAMYQVLYPYVFPGCSILEIGCSSGYYYETIEYMLNTRIDYTGVDYSKAFIDMAKDFYPSPKFNVADGAHLPFRDESFYISISSCVLLHVVDYKEHIKEAARVAKKFVIAHRTPVSRRRETLLLKKNAYDEIESLEFLFNEQELLSEFNSNGLNLIMSYEIYSDSKNDEYNISYVFEKITI